MSGRNQRHRASVFREPRPPYNISVQYAHIERALILIQHADFRLIK